MKRLPVVYRENPSGKVYWRSLAEQAGDAKFAEQLPAEFPPGASEPPAETDVSRRGFMGIMGAAIAMTSLAACRRPEEKVLPYARPPEDVVPGNAMYFATAVPLLGTAFGLLVESHEGRPTKIEGHPSHPDSLGGTSHWIQASVLDLYDPDRSQKPANKGVEKTWGDLSAGLGDVARRIAASGGKGLVILTENHRSPTINAQLDALKKVAPQLRVVRYEPLSRQNARDGAKLAFGKPLEALYETSKAKVLVSVDADPFLREGRPVRQARGFADGRRAERAPDFNRFYAVESAFSVSGGMADHRLRLASKDVPGFLAAVAAELVSLGVNVGADVSAARKDANEKAAKFAKALAKDLVANKGASLLIVGDNQPAAVHALAAAINVALGNVGSTVDYVPTFDDLADGAASLVELAKSIEAKQVDTLVILGGNPAFDAPADANFANALASVPTSIHLSLWLDETGEKATWHVPRAHFLEAWGDVRALDGTTSVIQPLIAPLYDGKTEAELLAILAGQPQKAYDLVRATWKAQSTAPDFERVWRRALHDGLVVGSTYTKASVTVNGAEVAAAFKALPAPAGAVEVTFAPDYHALDGRGANNPWLQEAPDPILKNTWGNHAWIAPSMAKQLGVIDGDLVTVTVGSASAQLPAVVSPGHADNSVGLTIGQGRTRSGRVVKEARGVNTYPLRTSGGFGIAGATIAKAGGSAAIARTQEHFSMEGRAIVREATTAEFAKNPRFAQEVDGPPLENLWYPHEYKGHKWGMTIDLNACTGCGACHVACQAENNIPVVGMDGVIKSREMHWMRIDRYYDGTPEDPRVVVQPMLCQHCENAPCEQVCPVAATQHSPEGTNDIAYNRCIGTRYCMNNCPYKVRRFNFFHYNKPGSTAMFPGDEYPPPISEQRKMQYNPDVTVRARGVVEKCSFCVQRINRAKIDAHKEGRDRVRDGEVVSACAQACPTGAITFGDLNDPKAKVAERANLPLAYGVLAEINTKPRVSYLARIRNPNPELEQA